MRLARRGEERPIADRAPRLIEAARRAAGLDDFGGDGFREGLDVLLRSLDREAGLNELGRAAMDAQVVDLLANRLKVEGWYARHPEIDDGQVAAPLIGLGLPRTGSTALACMLGEDPAYRSLRNWEAMQPTPPPDPATAADDPRLVAAEASMERRARLFPRMTAMLPSTATSPTECQLLMGHDFKSQIFQAFAHIPGYVDWLLHRADLEPTYRYVKRVLKLLQWRWPGRGWRIKNPSHSLFIGALDRVFPDARFVMTHRDVAGVIASVADLYLELHRAYSDAVDLPAIGRETQDFCETAMRRMIAFRDAGNEQRFFDIRFADFQRDPFADVEALYRWEGHALPPDVRRRMQGWREERPLESTRYERTDPAAFGLDPDRLRDRFRFYADRYLQPATDGTGR